MSENSFFSKGLSGFRDELLFGCDIDRAFEARLVSEEIGEFFDGLKLRGWTYTGFDSFGIAFFDRSFQERTDGPLSMYDTFLMMRFLVVGRVDSNMFEDERFAMMVGDAGLGFELGVGVAHDSRELGFNGRHESRIDLGLGLGLNSWEVESLQKGTQLR